METENGKEDKMDALDYIKNRESNNFVICTIKKSSSKEGKLGYDIQVKCSENCNKEMIEQLTELSVKTALKAKGIFDTIGI